MKQWVFSCISFLLLWSSCSKDENTGLSGTRWVYNTTYESRDGETVTIKQSYLFKGSKFYYTSTIETKNKNGNTSTQTGKHQGTYLYEHPVVFFKSDDQPIAYYDKGVMSESGDTMVFVRILEFELFVKQ